MNSVPRRSVPAILGLALALILAVPAVAGPSNGKYKGKTKQHRIIQFRVSHHKIKKLDTVVFAFCQLPSSAFHDFHRVRPTKSIKVKANGKFKVGNGSQQGGGGTGELKDGGTFNISGKIKGKKAKGSLHVNYTTSTGNAGLGTYEFGFCNATVKFSAKHKH